MTRININALRSIAETRHSLSWGSRVKPWGKNAGALVFAAVLVICSVTVGCSSDQPKPVSSSNQTAGQTAASQASSPVASMPAPAMQAETKPAPKKVVHRKPATVNYADKTYGVTFEYPRRYAIETGDAAQELLASTPLPMNFVQPGGVALAAVELPETNFANTDFSSAFFNVSVNKGLSADQCNQFAVPQPKSVATIETTSETAPAPVATGSDSSTTTAPVSGTPTTVASTTPSENQPAAAKSESELQGSKLMLGDLELRAIEAVSGEGTRQSDSKYFHVFQNGACYEFAMNVTTAASEDGLIKHVDRDKVFSRLETILGTVKINPVVPEVSAQAPASAAAPETPAQ
ncbi:MAG TPA: hypothetical protein VKA07_07420 [Candidatus Sulfotelmatobacter sp.]|nr:hypothetical protein [Candidatus Sulfotelmatobacter sp.]